MTNPPSDRPQVGGGLDGLRSETDESTRLKREASDAQRDERHEVHDLSRQHQRGGSQNAASLARERDAEHDALDEERRQHDRVLAKERYRTDEVVDDLTRARDDAEERAVELTVGNDLRAQDLRRLLRLTREELSTIEVQLVQVLEEVPRGAFEGKLADGVARIRRAAGRIEAALLETLDSEDSGSYHHDVGGSG